MLTVGELKEKIKDIDDNEFVFVVMDNPFTFGESTYLATELAEEDGDVYE